MKKKIALTRETLRILLDPELRMVAGGHGGPRSKGTHCDSVRQTKCFCGHTVEC
jgi:hypothetical protein